MPKLFSYGTLQFKQVQLDTFGRLLTGQKDRLPHYILKQVKITDPKVIASSGTDMHPILFYTGKASDFVEGVIFDITDEELIHSDAYEVADYKRVAFTFGSGTEAFVYIDAND